MGVGLAATGTERVSAPGVEVVLEVVRMAVNEQYLSLIPTIYPAVVATVPKPFGTLDVMRLAFQTLRDSETPAINGEPYFSWPASSPGGRSSAMSGPRPASNGRGRGRMPY